MEQLSVITSLSIVDIQSNSLSVASTDAALGNSFNWFVMFCNPGDYTFTTGKHADQFRSFVVKFPFVGFQIFSFGSTLAYL